MIIDYTILNAYETLCSQAIEPKINKLVENSIKKIQSFGIDSGSMLTEDLGLENVWEEICYQEQSERSIDWSSYYDFVSQIVRAVLTADCSKEEQIMIWMQSEEYADALCDEIERIDAEEHSPDCTDLLYKLFDLGAATKYITQQVFDEAADYLNNRIRKALEDSYYL